VRRRSCTVRAIWAACLLVAGANHTRILLNHGLLYDYGGAAWPSVVYWTGLTLIDPLVAALLFVRPRWGIAATVLLIVTNVVHNLSIVAQRTHGGEFLASVAKSPFVLSQIGFMVFVLATMRIAWRGAQFRRTAAESG
jgi:hypothetical protein